VSKRATSAVIIAMLLTGILWVMSSVQPVKSDYAWIGTIYIRADGSIVPPIAPISTVDNVTYTLTDNIVGSVLADSSAVIIQRNSITIDGAGHRLQGTLAWNSTGIELAARSKVTIINMKIIAFYYGLHISSSSNNSMSGNNITNNNVGICLYSSSNNSVSGNNITNNGYGIELYSSSDDNTVSGNNIANNGYGIELYWSSNNFTIYHNNFVNNTYQVSSSGLANVWDDGYPSGGNYWSDYNGTDGNGDGVGDTRYVVDANDTDGYPLMAPYSTFYAGIWNGTACSVGMTSNSAVLGFKVDVARKTIDFNVTSADGSSGFCRVTIPNVIVQDLWQGNYAVLVDGKPWPFSNWTDAAKTYVYLSYAHSQHETAIIPELPSLLTLPILMIATLLATTASKRKWPKYSARHSNAEQISSSETVKVIAKQTRSGGRKDLVVDAYLCFLRMDRISYFRLSSCQYSWFFPFFSQNTAKLKISPFSTYEH
jgi:parallel beta-helix repeat protein